MKKLSIEEKARRYDEAIERAKNFIENGDERERTIAESIFAGIMEESEDERIRKALIKLVKKAGEGYENVIDGVSIENAIAWLEKHGKQKPAWTPMDEQHVENLLAIIEGHGYPGEVAWLNSLKDRVQPKQEWSKEAENNILFLTSIIKECFKDKEKITLCGDTVCASFTKENVIDRLKSLRPQSTWKPSDKQLNALRVAIGDEQGSDCCGALRNLLNDLKSL